MRYKITEIAAIVSASSYITKEAEISILLTDSRSLSFPDESLFFAFKTKKDDGHNYIAELYNKRVRNFVVEETRPEYSNLKEANFLVVPDVLAAFQKLAVYHRRRFSIPVIGITGSNGKTIVKEFLYQLLHNDFTVTRSPRSYNSQTGVPLSVWQLNENTQLGIFEAGISQPAEMGNLEPIIAPTIGILTNIREAHQENFASLQTKCNEKVALFAHTDIIIYDGDNNLIVNCLEENCLSVKTLAWSKTDADKPLYISDIKKKKNSTQICYSYLSRQGDIEIPFIDDGSIENAIHCLAVTSYLGIRPEVVKERFAKLESIEMRLEVTEAVNNCMLINDSYNSDLHSLEIALNFQLRRMPDEKTKRTVILSDILETGMPSEVLYKQVAKLIKQHKMQQLIGIGRKIKENRFFFDSGTLFFETTEEFLSNFNLSQFRNETILLKGARKYRFELIAEQLAKKVHQSKLEVNLSALAHNFGYYKGLLKSDTKVICMVKAAGYGAGSCEPARMLQERQCDYLAVAVADEGDELRRSGITVPIIVMNPEPESFSELFRNQLEPEVYSFRLLDALINETSRRGITNYPIHIKIDTGMHRLGFDPADADELIARLKKQTGVTVRSVFTHLATADMPDEDDFTRRQIGLFTGIADRLQNAFSYKILRHALNSAGVERFPEFQMDMVRLGIGLYGVSSSEENRSLRPVSSLKTVILQIRNIAAGETIGYARKTRLDRNSRVAILPIGYADGINRHLSNGVGRVLINGVLCPIVGNVCMDVCMADITDVAAEEGDTATFFGEGYPVEAVAALLKTISYEVLSTISPRIKRVYFME